MTELNSFLQSQILDCVTTEADINVPMIRACVIEKVARGSLASVLGLLPGDIIYDLNGYAPAQYDFVKAGIAFRPHHYSIWRPSESKDFQIKTTGLPLGVAAAPSIESIAYNFSEERDEFPAQLDFVALWRHQDWVLLERLAARYSKLVKKLSCKTLKEKLTRRHVLETYQEPAIFFKGVALYERGNVKEGYRLITEFNEKYLDHWNLEFHAISHYYRGKELLRLGKAEEALDALNFSYFQIQYEQTAALIEQVLGRAPKPLSHWLDLDFPVNYQLCVIDPERDQVAPEMTVSLEETLERLNEDQLLTVCIMPDYRGNGPYNSFMHYYRAYTLYMSDRLPALHIITDQIERRADRPDWNLQEDTAREEGRNFVVLHDSDNKISRMMDIRRTPMIYLVNCNGRIVYEGHFDNDIDLWKAFSKNAGNKPAFGQRLVS